MSKTRYPRIRKFKIVVRDRISGKRFEDEVRAENRVSIMRDFKKQKRIAVDSIKEIR